MAFGEIFNPGMADARKQLEAERILPAPPPVSGPPPFDLPDLGVDFDVRWSADEDPAPWPYGGVEGNAAAEDAGGDDNGEPAAADSPLSEP